MQIITSSGNDIRQVLNTLQLYGYAQETISKTTVNSNIQNMCKDKMIMIDNIKAATTLLHYEEFWKLKYWEKVDLFFIDYQFIPLLVHDNYLNSMEKTFWGSLDDVSRLANAASYFSLGDVINN